MPSVKLSPLFNDEQLDNNGLPLSGGLVYWYLAGTTTPITVYAESSGSVPNTNPVVLNTRGEPANPIWLPTGQAYKAVLKDSVGNIIRTVDNISGINDTSAPTISEWLLYAGPATYINATQFSVTGDATAIFDNGRRIKATVSGTDRYATVSGASVYGAGVTTVTLSLDSGVLDASLNTVYYGFLDPAYPSFSSTITPPQFDNDSSIATTAFVQRALGNFSGSSAYAVNTALSANDAGKWIAPTAAGLSFTLPAANSVAAGATITIYGNTLGLTVNRSGSDSITNGSTIATSISISASDTYQFVSLGGSVWYVFSSTSSFTGTGSIVKADSPVFTGNPTAPTPATGDNDTSIATTAFVNNMSLGLGQTWQDVKASRALSTTYTNSTSKPIMVSVEVSGSTVGAVGTMYVNSVVVATYSEASAGGATMTTIVPNGSTYQVTMTGSGPTIFTWSELR